MVSDVFLSVGRTFTDRQRQFVLAVEEYLEGLDLRTRRVPGGPGTAAPLRPVLDTMQKCDGTVVIAFERTHIDQGTEMRGGEDERALKDSIVATTWNQIEAALGYSLDHPLLVFAEHGLRSEGLIEERYDWFVIWTALDPACLHEKGSAEKLRYWRDQVHERSHNRLTAASKTDAPPAPATFGDVLNLLRTHPGQAWSLIAAALAALVAAFGVGTQVG